MASDKMTPIYLCVIVVFVSIPLAGGKPLESISIDVSSSSRSAEDSRDVSSDADITDNARSLASSRAVHSQHQEHTSSEEDPPEEDLSRDTGLTEHQTEVYRRYLRLLILRFVRYYGIPPPDDTDPTGSQEVTSSKAPVPQQPGDASPGWRETGDRHGDMAMWDDYLGRMSDEELSEIAKSLLSDGQIPRRSLHSGSSHSHTRGPDMADVWAGIAG